MSRLSLVSRRPPVVESGVAEKFKDASNHTGWVQDSADNYKFGQFGTGIEAVEGAIARLHPAKRLRVLDAGCGSAGLLLQIAKMVEERGISAYLRGVTAERNEIQSELQGKVTSMHKDGSTQMSRVMSNDEQLVDLHVYQGFPLESLLEVMHADFVKENQLFDLILCSWTLFHLCDPLSTLLQLKAVLDPGGVMLANGAYFHVDCDGFEAGSVDAMKTFFKRISPDLKLCITGEPVRYVAEDPEDEWGSGEYMGGYQISLQWGGADSAPLMAANEAAEKCEFEDKLMDKVWHLASGPQYSVAAYRIA
eukprot:TRINITY_DN42535_c0_g1_i1.p1 TRINITY_DN42535_c0_g1~~TRINITY_DN42535_c0_g1_i1.p1  ORF type:complete len:307 (-),score=59.33 TRINITY_DN42535_c0_g1_i1:16-936(-)